MKKFQNAELVELNIQATAQANPDATSWDGTRQADEYGNEIVVAQHGDPWPSGGKDAQDFYIKG